MDECMHCVHDCRNVAVQQGEQVVRIRANKPIHRRCRRMLGAAGAALCAVGSANVISAGAATTSDSSTFHGKVNLTIWSVNSDGPDFEAIASGAIGDYGRAVTVLPDGKVDPGHTGEIELNLHHGSFRLYIGELTRRLRTQAADEPIYPATCSDYFHNISATVRVVAGSGTRAYRGIRGSFSLSLVGNEVQRTPPCAAPFASQILLLMGSGTVSS